MVICQQEGADLDAIRTVVRLSIKDVMLIEA